MRTVKFLIPLLVFAGIALFLFKGLSQDPGKVPSPLIGKAVPAFTLPQLDSDKTWSPGELTGEVWLLNVWGSWCVACVTEHPLLNDLARKSVLPIVGIAWKDQPQNSTAWLQKHGNPYTIVVTDLVGNTAIDLGVYGAPESYLIDRRGFIRFKQIGPFTAELVNDTLLPLVATLNAE